VAEKTLSPSALGLGLGMPFSAAPAGGGSLQSASLLWYETNDVVLNGTPAVTAINDQGPSGLTLGFAVPNPWVAAGGPNGAPYMQHQQHGIIAGASLLVCPATSIQTVYVVGRLLPLHGATKNLLFCDDSLSGIQISIFGQANQIAVESGGKQAFANVPGQPWYAARFRWNLSGSAVKVTGVVEGTDPTQPLFGAPRFWNFLYTQTGANYDTCLVAVFDEDTISTGRDVEMQAHILSAYNLAL